MQSKLALYGKIRTSSRGSRTKSQAGPRQAPHPIPKGQEGTACPITGLFADFQEIGQGMSASAVASVAALEADPDIAEERQTFLQEKLLAAALSETPGWKEKPRAKSVDRRVEKVRFVPLNVRNGAHSPNDATRRLVRAVGGLQTLRRFTSIFYKKVELDPFLDKFVRRHEDPHSERFALWIMEKFGAGTPWTEERRTRKVDTMQIGGRTYEVAHDRSSAHVAAWHSPKRPLHEQGEHFTPYDARVWMRLHFWAAREAGLFEPEHAAFMDYYTRFIGHFVSVYSSNSPPFTRESARWSADPRNIERYFAAGNRMADLKPGTQSVQGLPSDEWVYTGSKHHELSWPYELAQH